MTSVDATAGGGPLQGIRILDLTAVVMGPYATQILGDLGADVIKVEPPAGDNLRAVGPMRHAGMGAMALHLNRNKRSVVLDLKQPAGRDACLRLAAGCDALIYNTRPQAMARLGLDHAAVAAANPKIVYIGCFGYGEDGPYAGKPAYDDLIQGATGIASLFAQQSGAAPRYAPVTLADRAVGLQAAIALLAAVLHAQRSGRGQAVEVPMFEALSQLVMGDHLGGHSFEPPIGPTGYARLLAPHRKPYATADGHLSVLIYNDKQWLAFFDVIGRPELRDSPVFGSHTARAAHIGEVYAFVAELMATRTSDQWLAALEAADIPVARLHTTQSLLDDPHLRAVGFFRQVDHPSEGRLRTPAPIGRYGETPAALRRPAPRIGEHSVELLREAGYDAGEIAALLANGTTLQPTSPTDEPLP
ncbi:CoA transferase [Variovorax sp. J22P271]|uniref:CaiB/BaiF CoA transferase family protein n=1 Tax=Variovorax davisae TaxID=3053515 RepID=UPI002574A2A9|nr:CoA transferase [Variovorax sp. J22P271]MDM0032581.1 CoA transferase [Variovorax sp. J22P271]